MPESGLQNRLLKLPEYLADKGSNAGVRSPEIAEGQVQNAYHA
jgi:hypothetical protein